MPPSRGMGVRKRKAGNSRFNPYSKRNLLQSSEPVPDSYEKLQSLLIPLESAQQLLSTSNWPLKRLRSILDGCWIRYYASRDKEKNPLTSFFIDRVIHVNRDGIRFKNSRENSYRNIMKLKEAESPLDPNAFQLWLEDLARWNEPIPTIKELEAKHSIIQEAIRELNDEKQKREEEEAKRKEEEEKELAEKGKGEEKEVEEEDKVVADEQMNNNKQEEKKEEEEKVNKEMKEEGNDLIEEEQQKTSSSSSGPAVLTEHFGKILERIEAVGDSEKKAEGVEEKISNGKEINKILVEQNEEEEKGIEAKATDKKEETMRVLQQKTPVNSRFSAGDLTKEDVSKIVITVGELCRLLDYGKEVFEKVVTGFYAEIRAPPNPNHQKANIDIKSQIVYLDQILGVNWMGKPYLVCQKPMTLSLKFRHFRDEKLKLLPYRERKVPIERKVLDQWLSDSLEWEEEFPTKEFIEKKCVELANVFSEPPKCPPIDLFTMVEGEKSAKQLQRILEWQSEQHALANRIMPLPLSGPPFPGPHASSSNNHMTRHIRHPPPFRPPPPLPHPRSLQHFPPSPQRRFGPPRFLAAPVPGGMIPPPFPQRRVAPPPPHPYTPPLAPNHSQYFQSPPTMPPQRQIPQADYQYFPSPNHMAPGAPPMGPAPYARPSPVQTPGVPQRNAKAPPNFWGNKRRPSNWN